MLIDDFLPSFDVVERHEMIVASSSDRAYQVAKTVDLSSSLPAKILFGIRGIPHLLMHGTSLTQALTLDSLQALGFVTLADEPGQEIVMGVVGKFWRPDSGLLKVAPAEFTAFDRGGYAKGAMNIFFRPSSTGKCVVGTETRVRSTDGSARKKFGLYWRMIGPFSGLIRKWLLEAIKNEAEQPVVAQTG